MEQKKLMNLPTILTYRPGIRIPTHSFFILNKGKNSGRPMDQPCPNCFMISCSSEEDRISLYWICFAMWQSKYYYQHLYGSVIEYIRIDTVRSGIRSILCRTAHKLPEVTKAAQAMQSFTIKYTALQSHMLELRKLHQAMLRNKLR